MRNTFKPENYPVRRLVDMSQELLWVERCKRLELAIPFGTREYITIIEIPMGMQAVYSVYEIGKGVRDLSAYPHPKYRWVSDTQVEFEQPVTGVLQVLRRTDVGHVLPTGLNPVYEHALHITQEIIGAVRELGRPPIVRPPEKPIEPPAPPEPPVEPIEDIGIPVPLLGVHLEHNSTRQLWYYKNESDRVNITLPECPTPVGGVHPEDAVVMAYGTLGGVGGDATGSIELLHDGMWVYRSEGAMGFAGWEYINMDTLGTRFLPRKYIYSLRGYSVESSTVQSIGVYSLTHDSTAIAHREDVQDLEALAEDVLTVVSYTSYADFERAVKQYNGKVRSRVVLQHHQEDMWLLYFMDGMPHAFVFSDRQPRAIHYRMIGQQRQLKDVLNLRPSISSNVDTYLLHDYMFSEQGYIWDYTTAGVNATWGEAWVTHPLDAYDAYFKHNKVVLRASGFSTDVISATYSLEICDELPVYLELVEQPVLNSTVWETSAGMNYDSTFIAPSSPVRVESWDSSMMYKLRYAKVPSWDTFIGAQMELTRSDSGRGLDKKSFRAPSLIDADDIWSGYAGLSLHAPRVQSRYTEVHVYGEKEVHHHNVIRHARPEPYLSSGKVDLLKHKEHLDKLQLVLQCVQTVEG